MQHEHGVLKVAVDGVVRFLLIVAVGGAVGQATVEVEVDEVDEVEVGVDDVAEVGVIREVEDVVIADVPDVAIVDVDVLAGPVSRARS